MVNKITVQFSLTHLIIAAGLLCISPEPQATVTSLKETAVTENLFSRTKPQCIGRYLIDVPESFNNQRRDMVFIDEFKIESKPQYRPAFEQRVQRREKELIEAINKPGNKLQKRETFSCGE
ncbi:hypothetical protein [Intestinirhabdus alba]|jgi:hypothetical protein|uniref:hypothetical protein n=1 Tax=Intestinirhabdus alba TaxID=2899544 RepID=UPI0022AB3456|nr:hypothetical protein [Intestinirhabdus alba]